MPSFKITLSNAGFKKLEDFMAFEAELDDPTDEELIQELFYLVGDLGGEADLRNVVKVKKL